MKFIWLVLGLSVVGSLEIMRLHIMCSAIAKKMLTEPYFSWVLNLA